MSEFSSTEVTKDVSDNMPEDTTFERAMEILFTHEGVGANHKADVGGKTILGIAQNYSPKDFARVMRVYKEQGLKAAKEASKPFYKEKYYDPVVREGMTDEMKITAFNTSVLHGVKRTNQFLDAGEDNLEDLLLLRGMHNLRRAAEVPSQKVFVKGWLNRVNDLSSRFVGENGVLFATPNVILDELSNNNPQKTPRRLLRRQSTQTFNAALIDFEEAYYSRDSSAMMNMFSSFGEANKKLIEEHYIPSRRRVDNSLLRRVQLTLIQGVENELSVAQIQKQIERANYLSSLSDDGVGVQFKATESDIKEILDAVQKDGNASLALIVDRAGFADVVNKTVLKQPETNSHSGYPMELSVGQKIIFNFLRGGSAVEVAQFLDKNRNYMRDFLYKHTGAAAALDFFGAYNAEDDSKLNEVIKKLSTLDADDPAVLEIRKMIDEALGERASEIHFESLELTKTPQEALDGFLKIQLKGLSYDDLEPCPDKLNWFQQHFTLTHCSPYFARYTEVETKAIQQSLNILGYNLTEDGIYGPKTTQAVKEFQYDHLNSEITGVFNYQTRVMLNSKVALKQMGEHWDVAKQNLSEHWGDASDYMGKKLDEWLSENSQPRGADNQPQPAQ